ncbi:hypothetical protein AncyloWKF20_05575 [Ancylobacter sp. WKF20]|uniref:AbiU2 domain-containing protein n=1 Tax=Ancylobacter sp. WKF20 TaxID=3039801 RepID=UPI0024343435|nr:hypothetical protein [Ancylobacter sp. WKF20]WGD31295.1 hypothetical protein AncyloWKF20_05575 [Ancylobacter sp. WKF20]
MGRNQEIFDKLEDAAMRIHSDVLVACQTKAVFDALNARLLEEPLGTTPYNRVFVVIIHALMSQLSLAVSRVYDPDNGRDRLTLPFVLSALEAFSGSSEFVDRFSRQRPEFADLVSELIADISAWIRSTEFNDAKFRLKSLRDAALAHSLSTTPDEPTFFQVYLLLDRARILAERIVMVLHNGDASHDTTKLGQRAVDFWVNALEFARNPGQ